MTYKIKKRMDKKVLIFARVSSTNGTQDYERQINDLQALASANNWIVEAVFAEKVSGAKKNTELQSPNQKIPDRKTKCVIKTHINIKQNVIFGAKLKPV